MQLPKKALASGFSLPVLGLGTWHLGGAYEADRENDAASVASIQNALSAGITHIDTAERYGEGHTEEVIGTALQGVERRTVQLTSKVWPTHLRRDDVRRAAEGSLKRLKTDYLDLYLIHWPNPDIPLEETVAALDALVDEGMVKAIGVSNFSVELLQKTQSLARHPIVVNQVHYSLLCRQPAHEGLLTYANSHDVLIVAYRPLKNTIADPPQLLLDIAARYAKTPAQVALQWLMAQPSVVTVAKMGSEKHMQENLGAVGWALSKEDQERLEAEYPGQLQTSDVVPKL